MSLFCSCPRCVVRRDRATFEWLRFGFYIWCLLGLLVLVSSCGDPSIVWHEVAAVDAAAIDAAAVSVDASRRADWCSDDRCQVIILRDRIVCACPFATDAAVFPAGGLDASAICASRIGVTLYQCAGAAPGVPCCELVER